jgi:hypothetical protein
MPFSMRPEPLVTCRGCRFTWHSAVMAEGLAALGSCPRCGGELEFSERARAAQHPAADIPDSETPVKPPHLVLGVPRR